MFENACRLLQRNFHSNIAKRDHDYVYQNMKIKLCVYQPALFSFYTHAELISFECTSTFNFKIIFTCTTSFYTYMKAGYTRKK